MSAGDYPPSGSVTLRPATLCAMLRRACLPLAVLLVTPVLAACGGDDDSLSSSEFTTRGNAICQNLNLELQNKTTSLLAKDKDALSTVDKVASYFIEIALPVARQKLDQLEELGAPEAARADFNELIEEGRTAIDDVEEGLKTDPASIMAQGPNPLADFDEMARDIGLTGCAAPEKPAETTTTTGASPTTGKQG